MDGVLDRQDFDHELKDIWKDFKLLHDHLSVPLEERLNILIQKPKEKIDDESYMKIMFMKGMCYEELENKNAARYCAMRMLIIQGYIKKPQKKSPCLLDIQGYVCDEEMLMFIDRYTDFLEDTYKSINIRLAWIISVFFLMIFIVLFFVLDVSFFFSSIESIMMGIFTYLFQRRKMPAIFQRNQLQAIEKYVEDIVLEFDHVFCCM